MRIHYFYDLLVAQAAQHPLKENINKAKSLISGPTRSIRIYFSPWLRVPPLAPPASVMAMMEAEEEYGKY
jgi:hypothetical protein